MHAPLKGASPIFPYAIAPHAVAADARRRGAMRRRPTRSAHDPDRPHVARLPAVRDEEDEPEDAITSRAKGQIARNRPFARPTHRHGERRPHDTRLG